MKLTLLTLLLPLLCFGKVEKEAKATSSVYQDSIPGTGFHLHNNQVFFQKVFSSDLTKDDLAEKIFMLVNTKTAFKFNRKKQLSKNEIFLSVFQYKDDMNNYTPINASVVIQVKDYKYRVTISEINFITYTKPIKDTVATGYLIEQSVTDKNRDKFTKSKSTEKLISMLSYGFTELFEIKNIGILSDF